MDLSMSNPIFKPPKLIWPKWVAYAKDHWMMRKSPGVICHHAFNTFPWYWATCPSSLQEGVGMTAGKIIDGCILWKWDWKGWPCPALCLANWSWQKPAPFNCFALLNAVIGGRLLRFPERLHEEDNFLLWKCNKNPGRLAAQTRKL